MTTIKNRISALNIKRNILTAKINSLNCQSQPKVVPTLFLNVDTFLFFIAGLVLPSLKAYDNIHAMLYYYIVPLYLTGIFLGSYFLVRILLEIFDWFNFFWDWWDDLSKSISFLVYVEYIILGAFIYYIIRWELSGTP